MSDDHPLDRGAASGRAVACPECEFRRETTEPNPTLGPCPECGDTMLDYEETVGDDRMAERLTLRYEVPEEFDEARIGFERVPVVRAIVDYVVRHEETTHEAVLRREFADVLRVPGESILGPVPKPDASLGELLPESVDVVLPDGSDGGETRE